MRGVSAAPSQRLDSLLKNTPLLLILGGAAVHRCDKNSFVNDGFSRRGRGEAVTAALKHCDTEKRSTFSLAFEVVTSQNSSAFVR